MVSLTMSVRGVGELPPDDRPWRWRPWSRTARGRPPSPVTGAGYVVAMWWVAFVSAVLQQWACG